MASQALYRKWRSQTFETVIGQEHVALTLRNALRDGRMSHAYLFTGPRGTGKTSTARILAKAINCLHESPAQRPCNSCAICTAINEGRLLDLIEIDAASNRGIDEIRDLREKIQFRPNEARYKVYIIDEVHMLTKEAFNALLKTLEEPPDHAFFVLATTDPQKVPVTILSRCQRFDFRRIPSKLIEERLWKVIRASGASAEDEAVQLIARSAEGGMRDALSLLDTCMSEDVLTATRVREALGASGREMMYEFADALIGADAGRALTLIARAMDAGRDPQVFAREVTGHLRALLLEQSVKDGLEDLLETTREEAARLTAQAAGAPAAGLTRWMDLFMRAEGDMKWMAQPRSALELAAARSCRPEKEESPEALMERVARLEAKLANLASIPFEPTSAAPAPKAKKPEGAAPSPAPAPPKPKVAAPGVAEVAGSENYRAALDALAKSHPQIFGMLKDAAFRGLDGDSALLELPRTRAFYRQILEKDDKRAPVEQALTEAFGRPLNMRFIQAGEAPKSDGRVLEQAYDIFGRDKVSVLDE